MDFIINFYLILYICKHDIYYNFGKETKRTDKVIPLYTVFSMKFVSYYTKYSVNWLSEKSDRQTLKEPFIIQVILLEGKTIFYVSW